MARRQRPSPVQSAYAHIVPQNISTTTYRATMNGTTNVTITLIPGYYECLLFTADPTVFAYGSFAGAPTLPPSGSGTQDIEIFGAFPKPNFLFVNEDVTYNVKLSAAGTPELLFILKS